MKHRLVIQIAAIFVLSIMGCQAAGAPDYTAAGVVAYTSIQGHTYVLLADHLDSDRGWASFGGNREDSEPIESTALREFHEETRCVYDSLLSESLAGSRTVSHGTFVSYVLEVPYIPAQIIENYPAPPDCQGLMFQERGPWVWVPLDDVIRCLEKGAATSEYELPAHLVPRNARSTLWADSAVILQEAVSEGLLN